MSKEKPIQPRKSKDAALESFLIEWAEHKPECPRRKGLNQACTCGLWLAVRELKWELGIGQ